MISEALRTSITLRVPVFQKDTPIKQKIDELESYTLLSAFTQGELAEERLHAYDKLRDKQAEWDHLAGWEPHRQGKTEASIVAAKRLVNPKLYDEIRELEWTIKRLSEEIDRLEGDATKVSRAYTMMAGS